ncbi:SDR family oxidoreductase [Candidatus Pelagibacter sp. HIMB1485]|uniref:SDR family oxidoreductase n=1 Tax=Candidatus Pelagibacter sp. HIMB1485 TaxID=3415415 RepID=UPI003F87E53A
MYFSELRSKKIGVIGKGYIGSNLINYLKSLKINPISITKENIDIIEKEFFDYIINCAGNSGDFRQKLIETVESNVSLNSYILEKAKIKYNYIYLSSSRVYGFSNDDNFIFEEDSYNCYNSLNLDYIYDGSKKLAESLLINYSDSVNYKIAILRLSNVYGNFDFLDDTTLIKKIIRYKKESLNNLSVKENRYSKKDYIHINDVVENITNILLKIKRTDVYNLSYGKSYSIDNISNFLNLNIESDETIKPIYSNLSNSKIKKEFSIDFKYDFENGLKI